jgi:hypothetical protein
VILGAGKCEPLRLLGLVLVAAGAGVLALWGFDGGTTSPVTGGISVVAGLLMLVTLTRRD